MEATESAELSYEVVAPVEVGLEVSEVAEVSYSVRLSYSVETTEATEVSTSTAIPEDSGTDPNDPRWKPDIEYEEMLVDTCALKLASRPEDFDILLAPNLFGDILSDEAAALVGGLGFAAGANIGEKYGMFEPVHGSAPKYAGQNKVNPTATILAAKMMMDFLGEAEAARKIEEAVLAVLREGKVRTYDLGGSNTTSEMAEAIATKVHEV